MILLSTAYFPPIEWMHYFLHEEVSIETQENYVKQNYRNRCTIGAANGSLALSIPLQQDSTKTPITQKKISYTEGWQARHWRAIESAYNNSPYFEYFEEEIKKVVFNETEFLIDHNTQALQTVLKILRIQKKIIFTTVYEGLPQGKDLRNSISPREVSSMHFPEYYQVFKTKHGFMANLSILDLLFNEGLESIAYLLQLYTE